ncbi:hypothetical protein J6590_063315 [Homalodisca vitripennis]|nr:hypothetical protein J6590_063315 [Homalodisca vitripennis]
MDRSKSKTLSLDEVNKWMEKHCSTGELLNTSSSTFGPYILLFVWNKFGTLADKWYHHSEASGRYSNHHRMVRCSCGRPRKDTWPIAHINEKKISHN